MSAAMSWSDYKFKRQADGSRMRTCYWCGQPIRPHSSVSNPRIVVDGRVRDFHKECLHDAAA